MARLILLLKMRKDVSNVESLCKIDMMVSHRVCTRTCLTNCAVVLKKKYALDSLSAIERCFAALRDK